MAKEIIPIGEQSLTTITQAFRESQNNYLCLRIIGFNISEAAKAIKRRPCTVRRWRADSPQFRQVENYLLANKAQFRKDAEKFISEPKDGRILFGLRELAEKILIWGGADFKERPHILRAIEILSKKREEKDSPQSYEEIILARRKGNG